MERIVYTYLDYLLRRDGYEVVIYSMEDYEYTFRNFIEHFTHKIPTKAKITKSGRHQT